MSEDELTAMGNRAAGNWHAFNSTTNPVMVAAFREAFAEGYKSAYREVVEEILSQYADAADTMGDIVRSVETVADELKRLEKEHGIK